MAEPESQEGQNTSGYQAGQVITPGQQTQPTQAQQFEKPYSEQQPRYELAEDDGDGVSWTASEYISHEKGAGWFVKLALVAVALTVVLLLITREIVPAFAILFVFLMLGIYANRPPRQLQYRVTPQGIQIGNTWYDYGQFRSFAVMPEGAFSSVALTPLKRFAPLISIYYAPQDEDKIVGLLSQALPYEERKHDFVDRLMHRIRF